MAIDPTISTINKLLNFPVETWEGKLINPIGWMDVFIQHKRPKFFHNRYVIKRFGGDIVLSLCYFECFRWYIFLS